VIGDVKARSRLLTAALLLWSALVVLGGLLIRAPGDSVAIVSRAGWQVDAAFDETRPSTREIAPAIAEAKEAVFLRSWRPDLGATPGRVVSPPFDAAAPFLLPIVGYPTELGNFVGIECISSKERRAVATGNPHETWVARVVVLPGGWCSSQVRVVAESSSTTHYVGVGTPFTASRADLWLGKLPSLTFLHAAGFLPIAFLVAAGTLIGRSNWPSIARIAAGAAVGSAAGYGAFFAAFLGSRAATVFSLLVIFAAAAAFSLRSKSLSRAERTACFRAIAAWYFLSLALGLLLVGANLGAGPWDPAYIFSPARWSTDHLLPAFVAEGFFRGDEIRSILGGGWKVSDRPPLQAGLYLLARPLWSVLVPVDALPASLGLAYGFAGIVVQTGALLAIFWFIRESLERLHGDWRWPTAVALFTPFFLFNTVYTWPKLLSAGLAILAIDLLLRREAYGAVLGSARVHLLAGALFGFALLSHAGVAFGLIVLPIFFRIASGRWRVRELAVCAVVAVTLWIPWAAWQAAYDPPGNALTKFALAGTFDFENPGRSLGSVVLQRYGNLTLEQWLSTRSFALLTLLGAVTTEPIGWLASGSDGLLGRFRLRDFLYVMPCLGLMLVPLAFNARPGSRNERRSALRDFGLACLCTGAAGLLGNALITWSVHIQHTQSYLSLALLYAAAATGLVLMPSRLRAIVASLSVGYTTVVWIWSPLSLHAGDASLLLAAALTGSAAVALLLGPRASAGSERADILPSG